MVVAAELKRRPFASFCGRPTVPLWSTLLDPPGRFAGDACPDPGNGRHRCSRSFRSIGRPRRRGAIPREPRHGEPRAPAAARRILTCPSPPAGRVFAARFRPRGRHVRRRTQEANPLSLASGVSLDEFATAQISAATQPTKVHPRKPFRRNTVGVTRRTFRRAPIEVNCRERRGRNAS
jgi:hypothetical protein